MDIRTQALNASGRLHLKDKNGELLFDENGKDVAVNVHSPGTKQYAKAEAAKNNRMIDIMKKKGKTDQSADSKNEDDALFLADVTIDFENLEYEELQGRHLAMAVYQDYSLRHIRAQINEYLTDYSNF